MVLPFRKKPLSPRAHLWLLRAAIFGVAIFAFLFSSWYEPTQYIAMFLALTGAVFVGGAGSAIIGGLYWKRGTTAAAWTRDDPGAADQRLRHRGQAGLRGGRTLANGLDRSVGPLARSPSGASRQRLDHRPGPDLRRHRRSR